MMARQDTLELELAAWQAGFRCVAGIDEAGRGALAGPVVAAAVVLHPEAVMPGIRDSKMLSRRRREAAFHTIQKTAIAVGIGTCDAQEIDRMNILHAALEAMLRAASALVPKADYLLVDGNRFRSDSPWPYRTIVGGDRKSLSIAAASIVAKVTRDALMQELHSRFPVYAWDRNAGYPTVAHYEALALHGPTAYHRRSFRLR